MKTNWIIIILHSLIALASVHCDSSDPFLYSVPRLNLIEEYLDWELWLNMDALIQAIRLRHGASPLNFNDNLSRMARQKALVRAWYANNVSLDSLAREGISESFYVHPDPSVVLTGNEIMNVWYTQTEATFDYKKPIYTAKNLPFLNLVSLQVREYGCGQVRSQKISGNSIADGKDGVGTYVVCLFYPGFSSDATSLQSKSANINKPLFKFEDDQFNFSMTDDLRNSLLSRLEGRQFQV